LPVELYGCETWYITLRKESRQRTFEKRVLRKIVRFVIPVMFYEITNVVCVYSSNTTIFIGRI